jgi:hypothetical protein
MPTEFQRQSQKEKYRWEEVDGKIILKRILMSWG